MKDKEYKVGDMVWWARYERTNQFVDCPVCYRQKQLTVILGNGELVIVPCDFCAPGYEPPRGFVEEYVYKSSVEKIKIEKKEVSEDESGKRIEYRYLNYVLEDLIFNTKKEAESKVKEMIEEKEGEEYARMKNGKYRTAKSYAWHVGYHKSELKKAQDQVEYHSKKIIFMKKKAREV